MVITGHPPRLAGTEFDDVVDAAFSPRASEIVSLLPLYRLGEFFFSSSTDAPHAKRSGRGPAAVVCFHPRKALYAAHRSTLSSRERARRPKVVKFAG